MRHAVLLLLVALVLPACTEVELASHVAKQIPANQRSQGTFKVGTPYEIAGRTYRPRESYSHTETGIASWYGPNFHGKKTANGETFDKYDLTAAHRTLQMPSIVRVTNLDNGRSVVVRVNDRGPFKKDRVIDVSERAAEMLGFRNIGTARVKLDVLKNESWQVANLAKQGRDTRGFEVAHQRARNPVVTPSQKPSYVKPANTYAAAPTQQIAKAPLPPPPPARALSSQHDGNIFVQAGAFGSRNNALAMVQKLRSYGSANISEALVNGRPMYRVRLGPYAAAPEADMVIAQLSSVDIPTPLIVVE